LTLSRTFLCGRERRWALSSRPRRLLRRTLWLPRGNSICYGASRTTGCEFTAWISTFWDSWVIESVEFNQQFGMSISQLDAENSERPEYQWQQWQMAPRIYGVNVDTRVNRWETVSLSCASQRMKNDRMFAKICNDWIWKEMKRCTLSYKQQGIMHNSQGAELWFPSKKSRYSHFHCLKFFKNKICPH
jgi:hypothetical protein